MSPRAAALGAIAFLRAVALGIGIAHLIGLSLHLCGAIDFAVIWAPAGSLEQSSPVDRCSSAGDQRPAGCPAGGDLTT